LRDRRIIIFYPAINIFLIKSEIRGWNDYGKIILNLLLSTSITIIAIGCLLQIYAFFLFRKNKENFEFILNEFQRLNLQLDFTTQVATHFSMLFHHNKVSYFARLYKGVNMYHNRNEMVSADTYAFVQNLPADKIKWLLQLHKINLISAFLLFGGSIIIMFCKI